jgi:hypothetical protein
VFQFYFICFNFTSFQFNAPDVIALTSLYFSSISFPFHLVSLLFLPKGNKEALPNVPAFVAAPLDEFRTTGSASVVASKVEFARGGAGTKYSV